MRVIVSSLVWAISFALVGLSWAGQDQKQDKKDDKKEKVHEVGKGLELAGNLDNSANMPYSAPDAKEGETDKMAHQVYLVKLVKGKTYQIQQIKADDSGMIPYIFVENEKKKVLTEGTGAGGTAQVDFVASEDGVFRIIATTLGGVGEGDFTVKISEKK